MNFDFSAGEILLIDKPIGWSSFDVVKKVKNITNAKKVGHAGTLDPLATGLLVLCTGKATKKIEGIQSTMKVYTGEMTFGFTTPSYDLETEADAHFDTSKLNEQLIADMLVKFKGKINQFPPAFSAVKIKGKRAYELAREGKKPEIKSREVEVYDFTIDATDFPIVKFQIACSKGTYIRSLVHDLGKALNNGACMTKLRREAVGEYKVEDAFTIDSLMDEIKTQQTL